MRGWACAESCLLLLGGQQSRGQQRHRARAVLVLRALVLAFDHDAARQVRDAHRRVGLVDVLAAGAGGAVGIDAQFRGIDLDLLDLIELRQDRDRDGRGMDAPLRLGRRHALHAVGAGLELQLREDAAADDAADDFAVAAVLAGTLAQGLDLPALRLRRSGCTCAADRRRRSRPHRRRCRRGSPGRCCARSRGSRGSSSRCSSPLALLQARAGTARPPPAPRARMSESASPSISSAAD